jgi:protein SCO1/2
MKPKRIFATQRQKIQAEKRALQILIGVLIGLLLAGGIVAWQMNRDETRRMELQQMAMHPQTPALGGPFTLTDHNRKTVTDATYRGKYLLVYFGYTFCPDMCPTGLQSMSLALDKLGGDAARVQPLFITIDPARDTPAKLKQYVAMFHPSIVGLTGTAEQIAAVAKEYQVYYAREESGDEDESEDTGDDYIMDHSTLIYLMGPDGKFIQTFPENADPDALVAALQKAWGK